MATIVVSAHVASVQGAETAAFDAIALLLRLRWRAQRDGADPDVLSAIDAAVTEFERG